MNDHRRLSARVVDVASLAPDIFRVRLAPEAPNWRFAAGQHLRMHCGELTAYFSIASPPSDRTIELHVERKLNSRSNGAVFEAIARGHVDISMPYGDIALTAVPGEPLVLAASQSAYAQARSIIGFLAAQRYTAGDCHLLWSAHPDYLANEAGWLAQVQATWPGLKVSLLERMGDAEHSARQIWDSWCAQGGHLTQGRAIVGGSPLLVEMLAARFGAVFGRGQVLSDLKPAPPPVPVIGDITRVAAPTGACALV